MRRMMRWSGWAAFALLTAGLVLCGLAARRAQARGGQTWALVVGVDRYDSDQIAPLHYAGADAKAVAWTLRHVAGIPEEHVILMTGAAGADRATSAHVLARLEGLRAVMHPGDTLIFYFSGHGMEQGGESYLLTADADATSPVLLQRTTLGVKTLQQELKALPAARILQIVDACRNDPRAGRSAKDNPLSRGMSRDLMLAARSNADLEAVATLFSCKVGQRSFEGYHGHGFFTYFLVKGLEGAAAVGGKVTMQSLEGYLERTVPETVLLRERRHQQPWADMSGSALADWVLARVHGGAHVAYAASGHHAPAHHQPHRPTHAAPHRPAVVPPQESPESPPPTQEEPAESPPPQEAPAADASPASVAMAQGLPGMRFSGMNAQGYREFVNEKDGSVGIVIPGGAFQMGDSDVGQTPRSVTLPAYWIGKYPVTNARYRSFVNATGHQSAGNWQQYASKWGDQAPVVEVSWNDAVAYCEWAGLRLPTEEEWEKAARGTDGRKYPWGNEWDANRCRNSVGGSWGSAGKPLPVGSYASGASPYGCLDMAGNVWQWTSSMYDGSHDWRVLRGGSWSNFYPGVFRAAFRGDDVPGNHVNDFGFRSARTL